MTVEWFRVCMYGFNEPETGFVWSTHEFGIRCAPLATTRILFRANGREGNRLHYWLEAKSCALKCDLLAGPQQIAITNPSERESACYFRVEPRIHNPKDVRDLGILVEWIGTGAEPAWNAPVLRPVPSPFVRTYIVPGSVDAQRPNSPLTFSIDAQPGSVQQLHPKGPDQRFEGVAFSPNGNILGVATSDANAVQLFRRRADGKFEERPFTILGGLNYPHDLSFGQSNGLLLLAVAERRGAIAVYQQRLDGSFVDSCAITGAEARLSYTDGVAFVPPHDDHIAACNLEANTITFYRQSINPGAFGGAPVLELTHESLGGPDGLGFSADGRWLAVANHEAHSISLFERRSQAAEPIAYGPEPVAVIQDPDLRHTHSVAFTKGGHLIASSAGMNFFSVYKLDGARAERVCRQTVNDESVFHSVNTANKQEGGPKGVAVFKNLIAVCSPEIGIKLYSFKEAARPAPPAPHRDGIQAACT